MTYELRVDIHKNEGGFIVETIPLWYNLKGQAEMASDLINKYHAKWMVNIMKLKVSFCGKGYVNPEILYSFIKSFIEEYNRNLHSEDEEWVYINL